MSKYIKGKDVNLFLDGSVVAASSSCQFTLTSNTADASSKSDPGNGMFDNQEFMNSSWTASNESFIVSTGHLLQLLDRVINGDATVEVAFQVDSKLCLQGTAIITQLQISAPANDSAKLSLSLEGSGDLSVIQSDVYIPMNVLSKHIKGKALMLAVGDATGEYHTLAASTNHTLTVSVQTSDAATKDDNEMYSHKEATGKSVTLSTENLLYINTGSSATGILPKQLIDACVSGETLKMSMGYYFNSAGAPAGSDVDYGTGVPLLVYGDFVCNNISINGAIKDNATYSAEFACKGAPSVGVAPNPQTA